MKIPDYIKRSMDAFPGSFINDNNEMILVPRFNVYFTLNDIECEEDMLCKFCEWVSRDCCKSMRYKSKNHLYGYYLNMTEKFNKACGSHLCQEDMWIVYDKLGNCVNHKLTQEFVRNGFDLRVLEKSS